MGVLPTDTKNNNQKAYLPLIGNSPFGDLGKTTKNFIKYLKDTSDNKEMYDELKAIFDVADNVQNGNLNWKNETYQRYANIYKSITKRKGNTKGEIDLFEKTMDACFIDKSAAYL